MIGEKARDLEWRVLKYYYENGVSYYMNMKHELGLGREDTNKLLAASEYLDEYGLIEAEITEKHYIRYKTHRQRQRVCGKTAGGYRWLSEKRILGFIEVDDGPGEWGGIWYMIQKKGFFGWRTLGCRYQKIEWAEREIEKMVHVATTRVVREYTDE